MHRSNEAFHRSYVIQSEESTGALTCSKSATPRWQIRSEPLWFSGTPSLHMVNVNNTWLLPAQHSPGQRGMLQPVQPAEQTGQFQGFKTVTWGTKVRGGPKHAPTNSKTGQGHLQQLWKTEIIEQHAIIIEHCSDSRLTSSHTKLF